MSDRLFASSRLSRHSECICFCRIVFDRWMFYLDDLDHWWQPERQTGTTSRRNGHRSQPGSQTDTAPSTVSMSLISLECLSSDPYAIETRISIHARSDAPPCFPPPPFLFLAVCRTFCGPAHPLLFFFAARPVQGFPCEIKREDVTYAENDGERQVCPGASAARTWEE